MIEVILQTVSGLLLPQLQTEVLGVVGVGKGLEEETGEK